jgi:hypothetical protein
MIDPEDGALTADDPSFWIGPALTRSAFTAADWARGAHTVVSNEPWHSFKLDGLYCEESLSFSVSLYFHGEHLVQIELASSDGKSGRSWADYSAAEERQCKEGHDAWLNACLGERRSFAWGTVQSDDGEGDPHGPAGATITITYAAFPGRPQPASAVPPGAASPVAPPPAHLPPPPRRVRRRWWGIADWYVHFVISLFIAVCVLAGIAATLWLPMRLIVTAFGTPIVAVEGSTGAGADLKGGGDHAADYRCGDQTYFAVSSESRQARAMRFGNWSMCVVQGEDVSLAKLTGLTVLMVAILDGVVALCLWAALLPRLAQRRLVRNGAPCGGTLTSAQIGGTGRGNIFFVAYRFTTLEGVEMTNEHNVVARALRAARAGTTAVTVLYDPRRPKLSVAYEYGSYRVVPQARSPQRISAPPRTVPGSADTPVDPEVLLLVKARRTIEAIRRYRGITGAGLKEAKDYVDRL